LRAQHIFTKHAEFFLAKVNMGFDIMTKSVASFFCMLLFSCALIAQDISGFWKSIDDKTGKAECIVAIYEYDDKYYGRIIATYNDAGVIDETIYAPKTRAPGVVGNPFYCGLDFIYNLEKRNSKFKGKIMDPQKGNEYNATLWVKDGDLIVRGELFVFGRNQTWIAAEDSDFPSGFKKPDTDKFVPVVLETK
jgi:uncharacterized protein (DUF2147 family)